jgi:hypothetical protein
LSVSLGIKPAEKINHPAAEKINHPGRSISVVKIR